MRDIAMLMAMLVIVPLAMRNAFAAFIAWGWTVPMSLNNYLYGFMGSVRYNLLFAAITLVLFSLGRLRWRGDWRPSVTMALVLWFCVHASISAAFGYGNNPFNETYYVNFLKSMVYCLLIPLALTTRPRFHVFVIMIALGVSFHGIVDGLKFLASGGSYRASGVPTSMLGDNNHLAVGLVMALPLLFYLYEYSKNRLVSLGFLGALVLTISAVLSTNSRGGFICLAIVGMWMVVTSKNKLKISAISIAMVTLILTLAPDNWFDRMQSIQSAEQDQSFMGRVVAWKISSAIALANPVFGGGFHAIQSFDVWDKFRFAPGLFGSIDTPMPEENARAAHSIYFEIMGDLGFGGLIIFIGILASSFFSCYRIRRLATVDRKLRWAGDLAGFIGVALVAYMVGGAAVSLGYFEVFYMLVVALCALRRYAENELEKSREAKQMQHA